MCQLVQFGPVRQILFKAGFRYHFPFVNIIGKITYPPHHYKKVVVESGRMWILIRIRISMMHAVHDGINPRAHIRRPLGNISQNVKESFPGFSHRKRGVCRIPVLEKCLHKQGQIPVGQKKEQDYYHYKNFGFNQTMKGQDKLIILADTVKLPVLSQLGVAQ